MISPSSPSPANDAVELNDMIKGIVRLALPVAKRIDLLKKLYDATANVVDGQCVLQGPLREELHKLFTDRYHEVREKRRSNAHLRTDADRQFKKYESEPTDPEQEAQLQEIVEETRGDFEKLGEKLEKFGKDLEHEIEEDVRSSADAAGIADARKILEKPRKNNDDAA